MKKMTIPSNSPQENLKTKFFLGLILILLISELLFQLKKETTLTKKSVLFNFQPDLVLNTPFNSKLRIAQTSFPKKVCNITNYGATSDNQTINTEAFRKAINDCAKTGGGEVLVPAGTWLTGPIKLESNINLHLEKNALLKFSVHIKDYYPLTFARFEGIEYFNFAPPIHANHAHNIAITGPGKIDGQGAVFWWKFLSYSSVKNLYQMGDKNIPVDQRIFGVMKKRRLRPAFLDFVHCQKILLADITIDNGPMWTIHPIYSQDIIVRNVNVETVAGQSTDGIVIDSSHNVLVEDSTFATGDDAIVIKSGRDNDGRRVHRPSENIVLQNIIVNDAHGALAIGSEMSGNVRNILAKNFTVKKAQYGFRVKSNIQRGGIAENIWVKNFQINSLSQAVIKFNTNYERGNIQYRLKPPLFQNIHLSNFTCRGSNDSIDLLGLKNEKTINNITLKNIKILYARNGLKMNEADNILLDKIKITSKHQATFNITNSHNITISNSTCPSTKKSCLSITGTNNQAIKLVNNTFDYQNKKINISDEVQKSEIKIQ